MLADFTFTRIATASVRTDEEEQGTASFMAPELLLSAKFGLEKGVPSKESDIYALGTTVYQVLTGKWPFFPMREGEVMLAVISGKRPPKPENAEGIGMTEGVWDLLRECWREDRMMRPNISDILKRFCHMVYEGADSTTKVAGLQLNITEDRDPVHSESTLVCCEWNDQSFEHLLHIMQQRTMGGLPQPPVVQTMTNNLSPP